VTTTILAVTGVAHIGRRTEHAPDDGMMFRRRLIRSDEAWHDALTTSSRRETSVADRLSRIAIGLARGPHVMIGQHLVLERASCSCSCSCSFLTSGSGGGAAGRVASSGT